MPGHENSPGTNTEAVEDSASELNSYIKYNATHPLYESQLAGWLEGYHSRDAEVAKLNWTADRLYTAMCSRTPKPYVDRPSYASLEAKRAEIYGGAR